ncbi:MAG: CoA transferase [Blastomonas fulva]|uniref:CoA transferase n=1 Tax=Blastomonas fulva TaxID=1550728 RepID=UPI003D6C54FD|nr:CoA transferase [Blastomonas fulva]
MPDERPLTGVRVLELVTGPMAAISRTYVELGADVIRLEPSRGADDRSSGLCVKGISLEFATTNLGKRSALTDRLDTLVSDADIMIAPRGAVDPARRRGQI